MQHSFGRNIGFNHYVDMSGPHMGRDQRPRAMSADLLYSLQDNLSS